MTTSRTFHGNRVPDNPQISIVTPCYNGLPYLKEAIASVEELAEYVRVEHIVADGGSTDGSVDLLTRSPYVRGVSQPDKGLYSAVNWAITQARAPYIQWMNADDYLCPNFTRRALSLLEEDPTLELVIGNLLFVNPDGYPERMHRYDPFLVCDPWARAQGYFFNINSALYRTDLVRRVGDFDQQNFPIAADLHFQMRLIQQEPKTIVLNETAYIFRRHEGSLTAGRDWQQTVMRANAALYDAWSRELQFHADLRQGFRKRSIALQMGWALKCLRTGRGNGRRAALGELRALARDYPDELRAAIPAWLGERVFGRVEAVEAR